jgi:hypothetical protein
LRADDHHEQHHGVPGSTYGQEIDEEFEELIQLLTSLRQRWASGGSCDPTDSAIVATLRRIIESDDDPREPSKETF